MAGHIRLPSEGCPTQGLFIHNLLATTNGGPCLICDSSNMFTVYIIRSQKNLSYYRGLTELTVQARLKFHNNGSVPSTKSARPWQLVWYGAFETELLARAFEKYLKSGSGHEFTRRHLTVSRQIPNT
ncbi:MAG: GIY-YIG nuclease family protein [Patescibacteria group bacterium]